MQESDKRGQAREEAVSNAGPAADLSRDAELGFSVTRDVLSLAARMASALGISVPDDRWPTVIVGDSSPTSSYSPDDNSITIAKKDLHNGSTYAEEVTHFLKAITTPPPEVREDNLLDVDHYKVVQEICGRLGRDFAERLCAGSALAHLFVGPKEDEGAKISELARDASEKLESSQLLLTQRARALEASAALLRSLKGEVDQILDQEWQRDTTELPKATAFLKE
jgi:hypothetical protein